MNRVLWDLREAFRGLRKAPGLLAICVLSLGLKLVVIGVAIGTSIALAATRPLAAMLAGLSPSDPLTYLGTALILAVVGLSASFLPARRATRVDPMCALRQQ